MNLIFTSWLEGWLTGKLKDWEYLDFVEGITGRWRTFQNLCHCTVCIWWDRMRLWCWVWTGLCPGELSQLLSLVGSLLSCVTSGLCSLHHCEAHAESLCSHGHRMARALSCPQDYEQPRLLSWLWLFTLSSVSFPLSLVCKEDWAYSCSWKCFLSSSSHGCPRVTAVGGVFPFL